MDQDIFDWFLLLGRWLHITVAITWIGTSIFFMWLDRSFVKSDSSVNPGHVGEVWMVHGGGFYHVEKLLMGPTKVPESLHWFKWEAYWTWLSGMFLVAMIFYTGNGTFLLDETVSDISFLPAVLLSLFSIFGSWFFYDFLWERKLTKNSPMVGHFLTIAWFVSMSYILCETLSGRAAYMHVGGMIGTWMTANVFMRIIPRQIKMVEAAKNSLPVNQDWGVNAKNRSTHNTYFTLPVILVMISNHFPATYGHEKNWLVLFIICAAGAAIREFFIVRLTNPLRSKIFAALGIILILVSIFYTKEKQDEGNVPGSISEQEIIKLQKVDKKEETIEQKQQLKDIKTYSLTGIVNFEGIAPKGKKLRLPKACARQFKGPVYSNEVMVKNGKLQNVLVRIIKGHENKLYDTTVPSTPVEIDQKGCIYVPRVNTARVGQEVIFINSDPLYHNVKSFTKKNKRFNMSMPKKGQRKSVFFKSPEFFLKTKCSVHPWMGAYIAIMDHPFFSITDSKGKFKINNIPPGNYTIEFWHEVYGTQIKEINVSADSELNISTTFKSIGVKK